MADHRHPMGAFQIGIWFFAALDTIEEVAGVQLELLARVARLILDRFGPQFDRPGRLRTFGSAYRVCSGKLRHGVFRGNLAVAHQREAAARDRQASLGSAELLTSLRLAGTSLA